MPFTAISDRDNTFDCDNIKQSDSRRNSFIGIPLLCRFQRWRKLLWWYKIESDPAWPADPGNGLYLDPLRECSGWLWSPSDWQRRKYKLVWPTKKVVSISCTDSRARTVTRKPSLINWEYTIRCLLQPVAHSEAREYICQDSQHILHGQQAEDPENERYVREVNVEDDFGHRPVEPYSSIQSIFSVQGQISTHRVNPIRVSCGQLAFILQYTRVSALHPDSCSRTGYN